MKIKLVNDNFRQDYVDNILLSRGVTDLDGFKTPNISYLQSPLGLKNIVLGGVLYKRIIDNKGRILIIVDCDVDGFTSAAILYMYTKKIAPEVEIDFWLHEGKQHGLSDHIENLMESNITYDLLILPDSSSSDAHYHDMLDEIKLPCLILDHHLVDVKLSDNAVVVNNQISPQYQNKDLTGAGVVYQFCRYMDSVLKVNYADEYIDLAALGIVGDMGSMTSLENRYIVETGLKKENVNNLFLKTILEKQAYSISGDSSASLDKVLQKTDATALAFYVVPLINALIRVGTMPEKERLFQAFIDGAALVSSKKRGEVGKMVPVVVESLRECTNAKARQDTIKEKATELLDIKITNFNLLDNKILLIKLDEEDYPSELNGLIANHLASIYKRPTIVARLGKDNIIKGSARGLAKSDMGSFKKFMESSGYFEWAQGHDGACGCAIKNSNVEDFHKYANEVLKNMDFGENCYEVNFMRNATDEDIAALALALGEASRYWGQNCPEPYVYIKDIPINNFQLMGTKKDTVKIVYGNMSYLKFRAKDLIEKLEKAPANSKISIVGRANINEWGGRKTPQIFIDDFEINS